MFKIIFFLNVFLILFSRGEGDTPVLHDNLDNKEYLSLKLNY